MKFSFSGPRLVTAAYMLGMSLWFAVAAAMNAGLIGDRFLKQHLPLAKAMVGDSLANVVGRTLQATGFLFEISIAAVLVLGVLNGARRLHWFSLATALQSTLFAGFLATAFAFRVDGLPPWQQQGGLLLATVVAYAAISVVNVNGPRNARQQR